MTESFESTPLKRFSRKTRWLIGLGTVAALMVIAGFSAYALVRPNTNLELDMTSSKPKVQQNTGSSEVAVAAPSTVEEALFGGQANLLLIGVDSREDISGKDVLSGQATGTNGDTNLLVNINEARTQGNLVSVMRDTWIPIACRNNLEAKFNSAFAYGGAQCTLDTINQQIMNVDATEEGIDGVVIIDFVGFVSVIDAMGGLWLESEIAFNTKNMPGTEVKVGRHLYSGKDVLAITRERYSFNIADYARIQLQKDVFMAIFEQIMQIDDKTKLVDLYLKMKDYVNMSSNLQQLDMGELIQFFMDLSDVEWNKGLIPTLGTGTANNGDGLGNQSMVVLDRARLELFQQALAADDVASYLKAPENQKHW